MHLIEALAAGVRGAENGHAEVYNRGTSTRATLYSSFEGDTHPSSGANVTLDASGSAVLYVSTLVDVIVKDDTATSVREFTSGSTAANTELISQSFRGTSYTTGIRSAGGPTTVHDALSLWEDSAGSTDFNVLYNGVSTRLQDALGATAGIFYNVKSPEYGAVGDGVANDTTAIQNAMNAAGAAGGGIVFFPEGTYRVTTTLAVPQGASLWGVGGSASLLRVDHATLDLLSYTGAAPQIPQEVKGLGLSSLQAHTGRMIYIDTVATVSIIDCAVGGGLTTGTGVYVDDAVVTLRAYWTVFGNMGASSGCIDATANVNTVVDLAGCTFANYATTYNGILVTAHHGSIDRCWFALTTATAGTSYCLKPVKVGSTGPRLTITGCRFYGATAPATSFGIQMDSNVNLATTQVVESGCIFDGSLTTPLYGFTAGSANPQFGSTSREGFIYRVEHDTGTLELNGDKFGTTVIEQTSNANFTVTSYVPHEGAFFTLVFFNDSGAASGTVTYGTGFRNAGETFTAVNNQTCEVRHFRSVVLPDGTTVLMPIGPTGHHV